MASSRGSGARLEGIWQQAREPMFWLGADCKLIWVNRAWEELTGHPAETVLGLACHAHGPTSPGDRAGLGGSFAPPPEALAGHPSVVPTLILHAGGERRWRRVEYWPCHDERGTLLGLLGTARTADDPAPAPESEAQRLRVELLEVRDRLLERHGFEGLIGDGPAHRRLLDQVRTATATTAPVLIVGEPGTGKRLVAATIHRQGPGRLGPLVPLDCAAIPAVAIGRELFGMTDGDASPRLALPDGATLAIGDILDLPRDLQGRLAGALDGRVRVLAATTGDPDEALRDERIRPDLYYALTTLVIRLRPLRDRLDELPLLAQHFLERVNLLGGRQRVGLGAEAVAALRAYDWPGNLRELARVLVEAHATGASPAIEVEDLPAAIRGNLGAAYNPPPLPPEVIPLDEILTQVERRLIEHALQRARQNKSRAAETLGISRPRLYRRIKELDIPEEPEPTEEAVYHGAKA